MALRDPNRAGLERTVESLGPLVDELTLVGGASAGLLITDPAALSVRPTLDVDLVVEALTYVQYETFARRLAERGYARGAEHDDPVCRWRRGDLVVDVMPLDERVLGFSNRWYASAIRHASRFTLPSGTAVRHVDAPHFLATKLEAFESRGARDHASSHDLEDVVRVVDGRAEVEGELLRAPHELRAHVAARLGECLRDRFFVEAMPG